MRPFTRLTAVAAPIDLPNVDTDRVIPARFLRKRKDTADASLLFHAVRFDREGREREDFVLDQPPFREARILVTAENFGCGSSREWAALLTGQDEITLTLTHAPAITAFENRRRTESPWL